MILFHPHSVQINAGQIVDLRIKRSKIRRKDREEWRAHHLPNVPTKYDLVTDQPQSKRFGPPQMNARSAGIFRICQR